MQAALNVIEAKAHYDAPEMATHIRVARNDEKLYLDLVDPAWRAIEVDEKGWRIVEKAPVRFRRAAGMQSLPEPKKGGLVSMLRDFLNVSNDNEFVLVVAWALAVLRDKGPYPVLVLSGEQGSAKSTFSAILRALLDPNSAPLRALPRENRDLFIAATNGHVLTFDNVSHLQPWISDTLCRLSTGGGFAVRQHYTDQDEVLFEADRPIVLNGIEDIVTRQDLADRAIFLTLESIPERARKPERKLWEDFEKARPKILGALLDAVSTGLRRLPDTELEQLPRMADFALWATACEPGYAEQGAFWAAYAGNRDAAVESAIEADVVSSAILSLMASKTEWTGTSAELLEDLSVEVGDRINKTKNWPKSPRQLSGRVWRAASFLRRIGIECSFDKKRTIQITHTRPSTSPESNGVQPSPPPEQSNSQEEYIEVFAPNGEANLEVDGKGGVDPEFDFQSAPEKTEEKSWNARV